MRSIAIMLICLILIFLTGSCAVANNSANSSDTESDIPSDIEVVNVQTDRTIFNDLQKVEEYSTIIVEAVAKKNLGQEVQTSYDYEFKKELPDYGLTRWEIEVTKVYKGDMKAGDKLVLLQEYYIWTYSDGKKQLISSTSLKPAVKSKKYLLFLKYDDNFKAYCPSGDYEGMFAIPDDEKKEKAKAGTLALCDFDVYDLDGLNYLIPIYSEVVRKYFS